MSENTCEYCDLLLEGERDDLIEKNKFLTDKINMLKGDNAGYRVLNRRLKSQLTKSIALNEELVELKYPGCKYHSKKQQYKDKINKLIGE